MSLSFISVSILLNIVWLCDICVIVIYMMVMFVLFVMIMGIFEI